MSNAMTQKSSCQCLAQHFVMCDDSLSDQEEIMAVDKDLIVRRVQMYLHLSAVSCNPDDKYLFASEAERLSRELVK